MNEVKAITFDAAGTLIVPHPSVGQIYADALLSRGLGDASPQAIEANFRKAFARLKDQEFDCSITPQIFWKRLVTASLSGFCPKEELDAVFEDLWKHFGRGKAWRLLNNVASTLRKLQEQGLRLAVLSNNDDRLRRVLKDLNIDQFFERIFISWELGCEKPDGAIFQQVEEALDLPSSALLHVGDDRQRDWEGARNAGWRAILVNAEDGPEDRIPDLAEVLALVSNTSR